MSHGMRLALFSGRREVFMHTLGRKTPPGILPLSQFCRENHSSYGLGLRLVVQQHTAGRERERGLTGRELKHKERFRPHAE